MLEMRPIPAALYVADQAEAHAILGRKLPVCGTARTDRFNVRFGEFGSTVEHAVIRRNATFPGLVGGIVRICADEQMAWIAAGRVVAAMQDKAVPHPPRMGKRIGDPVGIERFILPPDAPVVFSVPAAGPFPTIGGPTPRDIVPEGFSSFHAASVVSQTHGGNIVGN